ncbi:uncharacterized protein LOC116197318 isoform X1 [Punica granatum]|nr:uncharacterized protein LOC116197318 isoform X1 [Punica granatum]
MACACRCHRRQWRAGDIWDMPVDPADLLAACKKKGRTSERSSESLDQLLHMVRKKKRSRRLSSLFDKESPLREDGNEDEVPSKGSEDVEAPTPMESLLAAIDELRSQSPLPATMGGDNLLTRQPSEMGETSQLPRDELEDRFQRDLNHDRAYYQQMDQLLGKILEAQAAAKEEMRLSEENMRASMERREELEMVVRAQGSKIAELFASLNKKDAELAEVCIASWAFKERIWELEVDLKAKDKRLERASAEVRREELEMVVRAQRTKIAELFASLNRKDAELAEDCIASWVSKERIWELEVDLKAKDYRLERASAEVKKLRGDLARAKKEASKEKLHDLAAESAKEAFSACVDQIKDRYPELDLSFCDLEAALEARAAGKRVS